MMVMMKMLEIVIKVIIAIVIAIVVVSVSTAIDLNACIADEVHGEVVLIV